MEIPPIHTLPSPGPTYELYLCSDGNYSEFPAPLVNESTPDQPSPQPTPPPFTRESGWLEHHFQRSTGFQNGHATYTAVSRLAQIIHPNRLNRGTLLFSNRDEASHLRTSQTGSK